MRHREYVEQAALFRHFHRLNLRQSIPVSLDVTTVAILTSLVQEQRIFSSLGFAFCITIDECGFVE